MNINQKTVFIALLLWGAICPVCAQQPTGYYFKDFTPGKVMLKNHQYAKGKFNYDCVNREMHFLNGSTDMIVENLADIDTIAIDLCRFIPYDGHFVEVMRGQEAVLFIDWRMKAQDVGKQGAMGLTTRGSVQAIDVNSRFQRVNGEQNLDLSVYKMETDNLYYTQVKGKLKSFRNAKTFIGLFPKDRQPAVKAFIESEKIKMNNPRDLLKVLDAFL